MVYLYAAGFFVSSNYLDTGALITTSNSFGPYSCVRSGGLSVFCSNDHGEFCSFVNGIAINSRTGRGYVSIIGFR